MSQNLPNRSPRDFLSLRHPNHFVLADANNRNVIITYRFLAAPVKQVEIFSGILTVYSNLAGSAGVFWVGESLLIGSLRWSRHLWFYDRGRLGRVEIVTLTVGVRAKKDDGGEGGEKKFNVGLGGPTLIFWNVTKTFLAHQDQYWQNGIIDHRCLHWFNFPVSILLSFFNFDLLRQNPQSHVRSSTMVLKIFLLLFFGISYV